MDYMIKKVDTEDVKELQKISRLTFKETFGADNSTENMTEFLDKTYAEEKLLNEIKNPNSHFFFLLVDDKVVGYLKVNEADAQSEDVAENALEIERIYLTHEYQHRGLGLVLIKLAEKIARENNKDNMWLGVWENNFNAQNFYNKDGFKRVSQHTFVVGNDPQTDYILVKTLTDEA
ncbi:GNAT family N-acetyltransferase [Lactobacillus sp.]|uniref:GNAT family N-acetyltransferase n=1 Tax=Lactobacillus sp. TaxID=1591 RepID=UPI00199F85A4|nr:GNAT family N-acetyltransferase [Lactobacillus sp.]MBD5430692.1 GNAT family N-acetyltransferase [Lactobacillus sp.]